MFGGIAGGGVREEAEAEGEGVEVAAGVDEGRVVGEELEFGVFEKLGGESGFAAAHGEDGEDGFAAVGEGHGVDAVHAAGVEEFADAGQEEEIGGFVEEIGMEGFDLEAGGMELVDGEGAAAVVDVDGAVVGEGDVAGCIDGGGFGGDAVVVGGLFAECEGEWGFGGVAAEVSEILGEHADGFCGAGEGELKTVDVEKLGGRMRQFITVLLDMTGE